jgi:hypothetical protein
MHHLLSQPVCNKTQLFHVTVHGENQVPLVSWLYVVAHVEIDVPSIAEDACH